VPTPVLGRRHSTLLLTPANGADALLATRPQPLPQGHSTAQRQPDPLVALRQSSQIAFPLIRHNLVAVVVDQTHFSLLFCS
jgi:hypothetical protein